MLPVPRIASSFFALWAFSTTPCVLNAAVVDSALGIVGIDHKISSSDWMRSRLYASSFVGHSSYSNFHATASFRKIDKLSRIFYTFVSATLWAEKLNQYLSVHLLGTFLCSRSARTILTKSFFLSKPWLFAADLFVDMSPRFVYFLVGKAREGAILNALKAPALLVLSIPTPWIKARMLDQNRPGVQCIGAVNQVKHASSSKNGLLLFRTLGLQHYTLCFECCCSRFCLGIVGIDHKISSSDWMRSRLYASSFVGHSSYSNFHATASFRKIDKLSSIFYTFISATSWAEKLNQDLSVNLLGTFLCSRSARLEYPRNDPLRKGVCSVIQGFQIHKKRKFS